MKYNGPIFLLVCILYLQFSNFQTFAQGSITLDKIPVILDTDANNEIDDQQALAYLLFNQKIFDIKGITVNATYNGGDINEHYKEAKRVLDLCEEESKIPLYIGANGDFETIKSSLDQKSFDGHKAVDFIINEAKNSKKEKLVILAIGKLTNIALAISKEPSITERIRLVWLGSNYPEPGEYNLDNDIASMNFLLHTQIQFEMVTVRYGKPSGTDAVKITKEEALKNFSGLGPTVSTPVTGRHGGEFYNFGDYAMSLFDHIKYYGDPPSRSLFDMAAVAIVKNPQWAESYLISGLYMENKQWIQKDGVDRQILIWENFNKEMILRDFYASLQRSTK
jgi:hypothetical protein